MPRSLTLALIGYGRWGRNILRDLVALGHRVIVATCRDEDRQAARDAGAWQVTASASPIADVDGAIVATPTASHAEVVDSLLDRVPAVFVEKPLTLDPRSARRLVERGTGRLFVMDKWRYHPAVEELARIARVGELGRPVALHTTRIDWGSPHQDVDPTWILTPHDLSIGLEILGFVPTPVAAHAERINGQVVGLVGTLGNSPGPWQHVEVSTRSPVCRREVRLLCEGGSAALTGGLDDVVRIVREDGSREDRPVSNEWPLRRELLAFTGFLNGGPPPRSSAAEGLAAVEAIAELRRLAGILDKEGE